MDNNRHAFWRQNKCSNDHTSLSTADIAMFEGFGVDRTWLSAACISRSADQEPREYGFQLTSNGKADLSGILFPYFDPFTGERVTARLRRDNPEIVDNKVRNK